jgi:hypothetical protein
MKERGRKALAVIPLNLDGFIFDKEWNSGKVRQIQGATHEAIKALT